MLKNTGVRLELLTDLDIHHFIERGMQSGISVTSKRYAEANNPPAADYDPAAAQKRLQVKESNTHTRANHETKKKTPGKGGSWKGTWSTRRSSTKPTTATKR